MNRIYFDLETQAMSYEVGGWHNLAAVRLALAVTWDEQEKFRTWFESQAVDLIQELSNFDIIIGYNINRFDYTVLTAYSELAGHLHQTSFDILTEFRLQGMPLVSLNSVARRNIGAEKLYKSSRAVDLWKEGNIDELEKHAQKDVDLTRQLTEEWENRGFLWINNIRYAVWPGLRYTALYSTGMF